jgi:hypothetical protein
MNFVIVVHDPAKGQQFFDNLKSITESTCSLMPSRNGWPIEPIK